MSITLRFLAPAEPGLTLADTLAAAAGCWGDDDWMGTRALIYTPTRCIFDWAARVEEVQADWYEARLFNHRGEIRWLRDPTCTTGLGQAVLVTEELGTILPFTVGKGGIDCLDRLSRHYLLWGQGIQTEGVLDRQSVMGTARIGMFNVPLPNVAPGGYARLTAREYVGEAEDGNVIVVEETLCGLEHYNPQTDNIRPCGDQ